MLKKGVVSLLVLTLIISFLLPSNLVAAETDNSQQQLFKEAISAQVETLIEIEDKKEVEKWKKRAQKQISKEKIDVYSGFEELDYQNAKVYTYTNNDYYSVSIPVVSSQHYKISNISLHFKNPGKIESYSELLIKESDLGTFQILMYEDGKEMVNEVTNETFYTYEEYKKSQEGSFTTFGLDINGFIQCMGLPSVVGGTLSNVCIFACMTAALCVPCAAVALGMSVGSISTCVIQNWD